MLATGAWHNARVARDRLMYRFAWLMAVALPLAASSAALFAFDNTWVGLAAVLGGLSLSAAALAAHLRLRLGIAGNRRVLAAVSRPAPPPVAVPAPADATEVRKALAAVEQRLLGELELLREQQAQPHLAALQAVQAPPPHRTLHRLLRRRTVAVAGSDALIAALPPELEVHRLFPSLTRSVIEASGADTIIVEEQALAEGPWRSTLLPQGAPQLSELRDAMTQGPHGKPLAFVIAQPGMPGIAARGLRQGVIVVDDALERSHGASSTLLDALITYRETHA